MPISKERLEQIKNFNNTDFSDCPIPTDEQFSKIKPCHLLQRNQEIELTAKSIIYDENQEWLLSLGSDYQKNLNYVIKWAKEHNCTLAES